MLYPYNMDYSKRKEIEKFRSKKLGYYVDLAKKPSAIDLRLEQIKQLKKQKKILEKEIEKLEENLENKNFELDKIFSQIEELRKEESEH